MINVNTWIPKTNSLGPGLRSVVWVQGCGKDCKGCISPEMKPFVEKTLYDPIALADKLLAINDIKGVTISGGEPFEQSSELLKFMRYIKLYSDLNIMVYSGYTLEEIKEDYIKAACLQYIDILIDGRFEESLPKAMWRGSINQKIMSPTKLFDEEKIAIWTKSLEGSIEFLISEDNIVTVGIPERGFVKEFRSRLKEKGINLR